MEEASQELREVEKKSNWQCFCSVLGAPESVEAGSNYPYLFDLFKLLPALFKKGLEPTGAQIQKHWVKFSPTIIKTR